MQSNERSFKNKVFVMRKFLFICGIVIMLIGCESKKQCPLCKGTGTVSTGKDWYAIDVCPACEGEKKVSETKHDAIKQALYDNGFGKATNPVTNTSRQESQVQCPMCSGTGVFSGYGGSQTCSECKGSGYTTASRAAQLRQSLQQIDQMTGGGGYGGTSIDDGSYRPSERGNNSSGSDRSCHTCHGTGHCQHCKGTGLVVYDGEYNTEGGVMKCPICKGNGRCGVCNGFGEI